MFAPVIIPTLNRFDHLTKCIESLKCNELAKDTNLYISLDFPPAENYREGYEKVLNYLDEGIEGFNKVVIYKQGKNLGPIKNCEFLMNEVSKEYEYCVFTEDDNIFSKNFLTYMNWAFKEFSSDNDVQVICGYSHNVKWKDLNIPYQIVSNEYNAWGCGIWFDKYNNATSYIKDGILEKKLTSINNIFKILRFRPDLIKDVLTIILKKESAGVKNKKIQVIDTTLVMYMILENKKAIMPTITKVNNIGLDGSGVNCVSEALKQMELDQESFAILNDVPVSDKDIRINNNVLKKFFLSTKIQRKINFFE